MTTIKKKINLSEYAVAEIEKEPENLSEFVRQAIEAELRRRHPNRKYKFGEVRGRGRPALETAD